MPEPDNGGVLFEEPPVEDSPIPEPAEEITPEPADSDQSMREAELREEAMVAERAAAQC